MVGVRKSHRRNTGRRLVAENAHRRLRRNPHRCVREVTCDYHEGVLFLHGRVPSYYFKQLAQESVRGLEGVEEIVNRIEVHR